MAGRVVSLVGGAVAEARSSGAGTNEIERIFGRAGEAIDAGLAEIADSLSQLGAMDARVAEDMAQTRELTHQGLNSLHRREALRPVGRSEEGFAHIRASSYQEVTELSFAARTTDGDVISINITREQGETSERMAGADARSAIYLRTDSSYASESFSYQVEGNLDEEERQALASLLGRVDKVANQFFEGDLAAAFEKVNQLELGSDEIAAMSLDLSHRVARSEISAYQSVSGLGHDDSPPLVGAGRAAGHRGDGTLRLAQHVGPARVQGFDSSNEFGNLLAGLDSILRDHDVERFFQEPRRLLADLLNGRLSLDRRAEGLLMPRSGDRQ